MSDRVAIVGVSGYVGAELGALLASHPGVELCGLYASPGGPGGPFEAVHPALAGRSGPSVSPLRLPDLLGCGASVTLLATPHEASAELVPALLAAGQRVIDLSGAFRLGEAARYDAWYGFSHPCPDLLGEAIYGLTELLGDELATARLVANPGCYATSLVLPIAPLLPLLDTDQAIVADAASGVSGAGKRKEIAYSFAELAGNFKAYGLPGHRHEPEVRRALGLTDGAAFVFVPHLLPVVRGILSTIHVAFREAMAPEAVAAAFDAAYAGKPFVRVLAHGNLPELRDVVGSPRAHLGYVVLPGGRRAVVVSALDNLLKGAASQAVQNLNGMLGLHPAAGLL